MQKQSLGLAKFSDYLVGAPYLCTAHWKGLKERLVLLGPTLLPVVTIVGL